MITWANLRASAAPWLVLPVLVYAGLYVNDATHTAPSKYGVQSGELAAYALAVIAPAVAGAAAWEAGRHRLLGALTTTSRRRALRRLVQAASPVLILQAVLALGALVMAYQAVGVLPGGAGWLGVAHLIVLPLGWLVIGWCLGSVMPRSIAAPIAGIACWAWLSMPHAMPTNSWLRHLGGFIDGLSSVTDVRTPAVYLVPWGVVTGLALAFWILARMRRRAWAVVLAFAVAAATFATGRTLVADWGFPHPTEVRDVALTCTGQEPTVCVPPEYEPYAEQLWRDALAPVKRLKAAGIAAPDELRITSAKVPLKPGTWPLHWSLPPLRSGQDPAQHAADFAADLAESAVTGTAALTGVDDCRQPGSPPAAWAALVAGVDEQAVRAGMPDTEWAALQKIRGLPAGEQADWFTKAAVSQERCNKAVS
ncbi:MULTISPECIES: hypothetical protein [unclassified Streptomyces]|uniref:DUF7224 domain-containing protein n=1 Tax=unclassified Streptomyces TaxID=2593676 RepID=UPI00382BEDE1